MKQEVFFLEEIKQNGLMNKKLKKVCTTQNYIEHFLVLSSAIAGCISISASAYLNSIPIGITNWNTIKNLCNNWSNWNV